MDNLVKQKMIRKEPVLGTFFELGSEACIECLSLTGLDFVIIDAEHGQYNMESVVNFIRAAELRNLIPFARTQDASRSAVMKMLDSGAKGIIVPFIQTVQEVKLLVEYSKYYPIGNRGFFLGRTSGYGTDSYAQDKEAYFQTTNDQTLLIPQCETLGCLQHIEEIVSIEGIDGIFIGPYDLSIAMGTVGAFDDVEFLAAIHRVVNACKQANKFVMIYAGTAESTKKYFEQGIDGVALDMDAALYINAYKDLLSKVKEGV